jgi:hypothetical protein
VPSLEVEGINKRMDFFFNTLDRTFEEVKPFIDTFVVFIYMPFDELVVLLLESVKFGKQIFLGLNVVWELVAAATEWGMNQNGE